MEYLLTAVIEQVFGHNYSNDYIPDVGEVVDIFSVDALGGQPLASGFVDRVRVVDGRRSVWLADGSCHTGGLWVLPAA